MSRIIIRIRDLIGPVCKGFVNKDPEYYNVRIRDLIDL